MNSFDDVLDHSIITGDNQAFALEIQDLVLDLPSAEGYVAETAEQELQLVPEYA